MNKLSDEEMNKKIKEEIAKLDELIANPTNKEEAFKLASNAFKLGMEGLKQSMESMKAFSKEKKKTDTLP